MPQHLRVDTPGRRYVPGPHVDSASSTGRPPCLDLTPIPADFGRGFRLEKIGLEANGEAYHVNLDGDRRSCECKGFGRWNHCKHADGLAALIAAGRL